MNWTMWFQALRTMPTVSEARWQELDIVARWMIASRASVLLMTLSALAIGALLAFRDGYADPLLLFLVVIGTLFAHATNNLVNDLVDHRRGIDRDNYARTQYGVHALEQQLLTPRQFLVYVVITGGIALSAGLLLVWLRGDYTVWLMLSGICFVLFYTWPLKYIGLGEPSVLIVWGPLMIGGSYYVIGGSVPDYVYWVSFCYALGPTAVLFGKHIDKAAADRQKGVYSLPVILGQAWARRCVVGMLLCQYLMLVGLIIAGALHPVTLCAALVAPVSWATSRVFLRPTPAQRPAAFPAELWPLWYAPHAFNHTRWFSAGFIIALLVGLGIEAM